jgi:hypothetical protein
MEAGLFGIRELQGGKQDFLARSITPVCIAQRRTPGGGRRRVTLNEISNEDARLLVQTLSRPELLHILAKWHVNENSGIPNSLNVPLLTLRELIVQNEGALGDVIRLRTARSGGFTSRNLSESGKATTKPAIHLNAPRGTSAAYVSALRAYEESRRRPERLSAQGEGATMTATGANTSSASRPRQAGSEPGEPSLVHDQAKSNVRPLEHSKGTRASSEQSHRKRYRALKRELEATRRSREIAGLELARRGLLTTVLDGEMCRPIMKGQSLEVECVKRNAQAAPRPHPPSPISRARERSTTYTAPAPR